MVCKQLKRGTLVVRSDSILVNTRQKVRLIQEDISTHGYVLYNGLVLTALTAIT
jgi:hypothetical protein